MSDKPLNHAELGARLGISKSTLWRMKRLGRLKQFEIPRPASKQRIYSAAKVATYLAGESTVVFVQRRSA